MIHYLQKIKENTIKIIKKIEDKHNVIFLTKKAGLFLLLFLVLYWIGSLIPEGFDWTTSFKVGKYHPIWTPWTKPIIQLLAPFGYGITFSLSMLGISIRVYRYNASLIPLMLAIISLPTLWVFFIGNIDGLVLFGLLFMPASIPLILMKPQLGAFILLTKNNWFILGAIFGLLSLIIWGLWPLNFFMVVSPEWKSEWMQDISLFPWGLIIGIPLLWFSRGDQDLLMASGSLFTPHLFPYHFMLLMPALARMKWHWMIITWLVSWTPLMSNWLGPNAWHLGNLLSLCFWFGIYSNRSDDNIKTLFQKDLLALINKFSEIKLDTKESPSN